jgi:hypothetical protein
MFVVEVDVFDFEATASIRLNISIPVRNIMEIGADCEIRIDGF